MNAEGKTALFAELYCRRLWERMLYWVSDWHEHQSESEPEYSSWILKENADKQPLKAIAQEIFNLHYLNFVIWHLEDRVRRTDLPESEIVSLKREIDEKNGQRNKAISEVDRTLFEALFTGDSDNENLEWNTESPGTIYDRLSVLALKKYHIDIESDRVEDKSEAARKIEAKRWNIEQSSEHLLIAAAQFFEKLSAGKICFWPMGDLKLYNDTETNPEIYRNS